MRSGGPLVVSFRRNCPLPSILKTEVEVQLCVDAVFVEQAQPVPLA
jgi:hypothetical protein